MHNSGEKYITKHGFTAIKDGIKARVITQDIVKPAWLKVTAYNTPKYLQTKNIVHEHGLSTVCEEAKCPNINECWSHGTATIMLMGSVCTRACRFCAVDTGNPQGWLDRDEPTKVARSVQLMQLRYVVLTSVNRDDLLDGGATHYAKTISSIKQQCVDVKVEALTPDFQGQLSSVDIILQSGVDVFAHNIETVPRLTAMVRDPRANYQQSLAVLRHVKQNSLILAKTSLMLGLGETEQELMEVLQELRDYQIDIITLGQYLQPTRYHLPVVRYVTEEEFKQYRIKALKLGFKEVASGPFVRSSYRADKVFFATQSACLSQQEDS